MKCISVRTPNRTSPIRLMSHPRLWNICTLQYIDLARCVSQWLFCLVRNDNIHESQTNKSMNLRIASTRFCRKRAASLVVIALSCIASLLSASGGDELPKVVKIGYQRASVLALLKSRGNLDKRLADLGVQVEWILFPAGPQLLEGLNAGAIDVGEVGEAPPIFAQAAGVPFVYIASEPPSPKAEGLLVPKDSPIKSIADLSGKKVALNRGSNVHYFLVKALESEGLKYSDIQPVFLAPADARAAFDGGSLDAWVVWDAYLSVA